MHKLFSGRIPSPLLICLWNQCQAISTSAHPSPMQIFKNKNELSLEVGSMRTFVGYSNYMNIYLGLSVVQIGSLISNNSFGSVILEGNSTLLDPAKSCSLSAFFVCCRCVSGYFNVLAKSYLKIFSSEGLYAASSTVELQ